MEAAEASEVAEVAALPEPVAELQAEEASEVAEVAALAEVQGDVCTSGLVGRMRSIAPSCIDSCRSSCGAWRAWPGPT